MAVTLESLTQSCQQVLAGDPHDPPLGLQEYIAAVPEIDQLADLPQGTSVLIRGDVDAKVGEQVGDGDIRLRSMKETLQFGLDRGWKQIIFGHIGRKPEGSLSKVAARLGEIMGCDVTLISDWADDATGKVLDDAAQTIADAAPGSIILLENTRKYDLERVLWKKQPTDLSNMQDELEKLTTFANEVADKIANVYVLEAFSAGSLDTSTVVIPAAMEKVALGRYVAGELKGPLTRCLAARLVVFSGIKTDKFDDLEAMIDRGSIGTVIAAGSLAMALKKADVEANGGEFCLGQSEDPANKDMPFYISPDRIEQARRVISKGKKNGITFVLPVDFVMEDGTVVSELGPDDIQFDIGPATSELFEKAIGDFIDANLTDGDKPVVAFYNGVFGKFEDEQFAVGTKRFMNQLQRLEDEGVHVYVGGGEGGKAVTDAGLADKVTHLFTAGGTVLNALGSDPIPYLVSLRLASSGK